MSVINSDSVRAGASGAVSEAYTIEQSCRFNDDDTAILTRTPLVAGNRRTWTFSAWVKRGHITDNGSLLSAGTNNSTDVDVLRFGADDKLDFIIYHGSAVIGRIITTQVLRDPSA